MQFCMARSRFFTRLDDMNQSGYGNNASFVRLSTRGRQTPLIDVFRSDLCGKDAESPDRAAGRVEHARQLARTSL